MRFDSCLQFTASGRIVDEIDRREYDRQILRMLLALRVLGAFDEH
jgi:hypothetical protein